MDEDRIFYLLKNELQTRSYAREAQITLVEFNINGTLLYSHRPETESQKNATKVTLNFKKNCVIKL